MLDQLIGLISPKAAYERAAWRVAHRELSQIGGQRSFAAADRGRKTADWRASYGSGDTELFNDIGILRARSRQMTRDNPYIAAGVRNLTAGLSGITARAVHADPKIAALAQSIWDDKAREPMDVEERNDFYACQKIAIRSAIEGGETLVSWRALGKTPDARVMLIEGDQLDQYRSALLPNGNRIVMGVEFDPNGRRVAYHMFDHHPGDQLAWLGVQTKTVPAQDVDHLFERLRISGQARGVPWFHAALIRVREIGEVEESTRIKRRIEACLAIFRRPGDAGNGSPLGEQQQKGDTPPWETIRPGMIVQGQPGEDLTVVNPSAGQDEGFLRSQMMSAAAGAGVPYFIFTGDVSQANFSSQRADMIAYWLRQDDWTHHTIVPGFCRPWFNRVMAVAAVQRNQPELLKVKAEWTPEPRPFVNPLQDVTAELIEVRAGLTSLAKAHAERGLDSRKVLEDIARTDKIIDELGLVLDSDPRRTNDLGALQAAAGYIAPRGDKTST